MIATTLLLLGIAQADSAFARERPTATIEIPPPVAPEAKTIAAANRLLTAMNIDAQYDSILGQMIPVMSAQVFQQVRDNVQTPDSVRRQLDDPAKLAKLREIFAEEVTKEFRARYGKIRTETAREYARLFTAEELNEIADFYSRPAGRKALEVMPQLNERLFPIGMRIGAEAGRAAMKTTLERHSLASERPNT